MNTQTYLRAGRATDALRKVRITRGYTIHAEGSV
ncbi:MAG: ribonuclease PH, partial [Limnohabitans sp.]